MVEGWGWTFLALEHWNAECLGWHVCKQGTRFAALTRDLDMPYDTFPRLAERRTLNILNLELFEADGRAGGRPAGKDAATLFLI